MWRAAVRKLQTSPTGPHLPVYLARGHFFFFESAFVVKSTNPMVPCERSFAEPRDRPHLFEKSGSESAKSGRSAAAEAERGVASGAAPPSVAELKSAARGLVAGVLPGGAASMALGLEFFFFESAFVVNSTNPMVLCERSFVAVAHTHTPCRTARPPTAPPRRERDEEMGQQRRSTSTYGRVQNSC